MLDDRDEGDKEGREKTHEGDSLRKQANFFAYVVGGVWTRGSLDCIYRRGIRRACREGRHRGTRSDRSRRLAGPGLGGSVWGANRSADAGSGHRQDPGRHALRGRSRTGLTRRRSSHPGGPVRG